MARILVVEDDPTMAEVVSANLRDDGHDPVVFANGMDALIAATTLPFDAAAIDVMLPGMTGFELCRQLRDRDLRLPILMLTARDSVDDRVRGLDAGADDYLIKPFALPEFSARIRALLRREPGSAATGVAVGNVAIDFTRSRVTVSDEPMSLTGRELALLRDLMLRSPGVATRAELLEEIWGTVHIDANIVDQYVRYLRRKLDAAEATIVIDAEIDQAGELLLP